jgi:predicted RNA-binding Zn ribbon-like protein
MSLARYVPATAPGGLALVQGLLNTRATASGYSDLLDDAKSARQFLDDGLQEWGRLTGSDPVSIAINGQALHELRELRDRVRRYIGGERSGAIIDQPIAVVSTDDGTLRTQPTGTGIRWIESAIWGALLMEQDRDTLRRLKLCRNEYCGSAFYDRSKNNSGVWHDVHVCGNAANLRASRARRKTTGR